MRCKSNSASTSVRGEDVCKDCVVSYISKRARNALTGPPQLAQPVALCVGSGCTSSLLLDHGQGIMHCGRKRRYWQDATVVHVQDPGIGKAADRVEALRATRAVLTMSLRSGLQTVVIPIECGVPGSPLVSIIARPPLLLTTPDRLPPQHPLNKHYVHEQAAVEPIVAATLSALESLRGAPSFAPWCSQWYTWLDHPSLSADAQQHLCRGSIRRLCVEAALHLAMPYVIVGSCVDTLAEGVMTSMACGSGASVPCDVSPIDRRWMAAGTGHNRTLCTLDMSNGSLSAVESPLPSCWYPAQSQEMPLGPVPARLTRQPTPSRGVLLLRPFLELERQEIALYVQYRALSLQAAQPSAPAAPIVSPKSSIASVNSAVLASLHASFPATLHNVVRTARKLALPWDEEGFTAVENLPAMPLCQLCQGLVQSTIVGTGGMEVWCAACERVRGAWLAATQEDTSGQARG